MLVLTIRSDKPEAEIGLFLNDKSLVYEKWNADRQLSVTIHLKIDQLLKDQGKDLKDLGGIVCFKGPGSFTGLRIGLSAGNALAYGLDIPITASAGENWIEVGLSKLLAGKNEKVALPEYGSPPHITLPKH